MAAAWEVFRTGGGSVGTVRAGDANDPKVEAAESAEGDIFRTDFNVWLTMADFDVYADPQPAMPVDMDWRSQTLVQQALRRFELDSDGKYEVRASGLDLGGGEVGEPLEEGAIP